MRSLLAGWRVSLRRTRTDWPIVAAAGLITLLAAILLSAGPIYSSAASSAGLHRALADAPAADVSIQVSLYSESGVAADVGGRVQGELQRVIAPVGGSIVRDWRGVSLLELPRLSGGEAGDQAIVGVPGRAARPRDAGRRRLAGGGWRSVRPDSGGGRRRVAKELSLGRRATC